MLPDEPWLRKSPAEGVLFWTDECKEIGRFGPWAGEAEREDWKRLEFAVEPSEKDYFSALAGGVARTADRVLYLRQRLWWAGNDPIRREGTGAPSQWHVDNLIEFAALLSVEDEQQRLMKAEGLRELGRFGEAIDLLSDRYSCDLTSAVARIRTLCHERSTQVARLN